VILEAPSNPTCPFAADYKTDSEQIPMLPPPARKRKSNFQSSFVRGTLHSAQKEEEVLSDPSLPQGKLRTAAIRWSHFATECRFTRDVFASQEQARGTDQEPGGCRDREQCANKFFPNIILDQETKVLRELML